MSWNLIIHTISHSGNNRHLFEILKSGSIDIALCYLDPLRDFDNKISVINLPFLFSSPEEAYSILDGPIGKELYQGIESSGLIGLNYWSMGWRHISSRDRQIRVPEDMRGLKIRIMYNDIAEAYFKLLGAVPIKMNYDDVLQALRQGLVDSQENPYTNFLGMKFYQSQNYVNETMHNFDLEGLFTTRITWAKLNSHQREIIIDSATEATNWQRSEMEHMNENNRRQLQEQYGTKIVTLTDKERARWIDSVKPLYWNFEHQDILNKILAAKERYHAEEICKKSI